MQFSSSDSDSMAVSIFWGSSRSSPNDLSQNNNVMGSATPRLKLKVEQRHDLFGEKCSAGMISHRKTLSCKMQVLDLVERMYNVIRL